MGMTTKFCPNCGQNITSTDEFCPNCGTNLKDFQTSSVEPKKSPVQEPTAQPQITASKPRKKGKVFKSFMTIIVLGLIVFLAYFSGSWYFGKDRQLQTLTDNLTSGLTPKMVQAAVNTDGSKLSETELKPLANLYIKNSDSINEIKHAIKSPKGYDNFKIIESGKFWGIYPKYKVAIAKQYIPVDTNADSPIFEINGKKASAINDGEIYKLDKSIPGAYTITVKGKTDQKTKDILIPATGKAESYTATFEKPLPDFDPTLNDEDYSDSSDKKTVEDTPKKVDTTSEKKTSTTDEKQPTDLVGKWVNSTSTIHFYSDGTYRLDDKQGKYQIKSQDGDQVTISYSEDGKQGPGWTASYTLKDNKLELNSNHMSWYKD